MPINKINKKYISVRFSESELKERNRELSILLEMSDLTSTAINLKDLLAVALSKVLEYFDLEAGRIYLTDEEEQYLHLAAHQGVVPEGLEKVHINEGFTGKSARTKSFIGQHVSELEDKRRAAFLLSKGIKGVICVPLITMNKTVGVMNLAANKMIKLDQFKIDLLRAMGNQIAVAATNARLFEELKNKIETIKEKKEMIKFFAYSVSHDLKSPATSVYGLAKRLQEKYEDSLDGKGRAYCDQLLKTSEQMVSLVEDINVYIATKEVPLNIERIDVKEITEGIREGFSTILLQRRIKWVQPEHLPEIFADRLALSRVFRNLVDNALKYGGEKLHEIKLGYKESNSFHIFSFGDDGVGIREGDREKIFEVFQRHETSKGTAGSGLGLAIVREVAARHRGNAWVDSGGERGTTFYVSIPTDLEPKL
jgi:K+-sensing histidine kinase KdpD